MTESDNAAPGADILNGNVQTVEAALGAAVSAGTLDAEGLGVLRVAEVDGKNRDGVLSAIGRLLAQLEGEAEPAKPADPADHKPWLRQDYNGPISTTQALERNRHFSAKRAR